MEPVTLVLTALATAAAQGVIAGATEAGKKTIVDAYSALKKALLERAKAAGKEDDVKDAVAGVEKKPESEGRQTTLKEELEAVKLDDELVELARKLLELADPDGSQQSGGVHVGNISNVSGGEINIAGRDIKKH